MRRKDATILAGIALFYVALEGLGITCPIKFLSGVSCPGCGMSRAWLAALRLDFAAAFFYHPLWLLPIPGAAVLLFQKRLDARVFNAVMWALGGLFLAVYFFRLVTPEEVVVFAPWDGAVWRLLARR